MEGLDEEIFWIVRDVGTMLLDRGSRCLHRGGWPLNGFLCDGGIHGR